MPGENTAWIKMADQEAEALAQMLATNGRCVMVIVIGAESDQAGTTYVLHAAAGNTKARTCGSSSRASSASSSG
jgi:hypothetical protein